MLCEGVTEQAVPAELITEYENPELYVVSNVQSGDPYVTCNVSEAPQLKSYVSVMTVLEIPAAKVGKDDERLQQPNV